MARNGSKKAEEWLNNRRMCTTIKTNSRGSCSTGDCRQCKELSSLGGSWTSILESFQNQVEQSPEQPGLDQLELHWRSPEVPSSLNYPMILPFDCSQYAAKQLLGAGQASGHGWLRKCGKLLGRAQGKGAFPSHTPSLFMESEVKEKLPCPQHRGFGNSKSSHENGAGAGKMAGNSPRQSHNSSTVGELCWWGFTASQKCGATAASPWNRAGQAEPGDISTRWEPGMRMRTGRCP